MRDQLDLKKAGGQKLMSQRERKRERERERLLAALKLIFLFFYNNKSLDIELRYLTT